MSVPLGSLLMAQGLITQAQLDEALRLQLSNRRMLGTCLLALDAVDPDVLLHYLSVQLGLPILPSGTLGQASPDAIRRVPGELAWRLKVLPYSWDGEVLGLAIADGRVLNELSEIAQLSQSAVGAYLGLEMEIESVLRAVYRAHPTAVPVPAARPAPPTPTPVQPPAQAPAPAPQAPDEDDFGRLYTKEISNLSFGAVAGFDDVVVLDKPKAKPKPTVEQPPMAVLSVLPPEPALEPTLPVKPLKRPSKPEPVKVAAKDSGPASTLRRIRLYDAVEQVYLAKDPRGVAEILGGGLMEYFKRVVVFRRDEDWLYIAGYTGFACSAKHIEVSDPWSSANAVSYCELREDPRMGYVTGRLGMAPPTVGCFATLEVQDRDILAFYADNGPDGDIYDDLHDVELLVKESRTALVLLIE